MNELNFDAFEPLLSFELIYFRNSFCYRMENSWSFRNKILGHVAIGPLRKNLNFLSPLGSLKFTIFWAFNLCWSCPAQNLSQQFELCLYCKYWRSCEVLWSRRQNFWNTVVWYSKTISLKFLLRSPKSSKRLDSVLPKNLWFNHVFVDGMNSYECIYNMVITSTTYVFDVVIL